MKLKTNTLLIILLVLLVLFFVMRSSGYDTPTPGAATPEATTPAMATPMATTPNPQQKFTEFLGAVRDSMMPAV